MSDEEDSREQGIEFGDLEEKLDDHEYPATAEELVDEYGDHELELPSGARTFGEILEPYQEESGEEFERAEEVRQAVFNMVGSEAVGREGYSDRGLETEGEGGENESF
ncbi:DUF5789 family protein [Halegenticoccus tardaugens]|uniref:DUF5789 family protein n=1 Tax=Halegenticoccus tardaugens TaxID=2071624 RepID=UPI00100B37E2|nr:hypothetical protein [Halegenticoccus tardaugens]